LSAARSVIVPSASARPRWESARIRHIDRIGLVLIGAAVAWSAVSAVSAGGDAGPVIALLIATVFVLAISRWIATRVRWLPLLIVSLAAAVFGVRFLDGLWSKAPLAGPLGYANAKGAFFALAAIGVLMLALETERISVRIAAVSTALVFASVPLVTKALVSTWLVLVLPVGALLAVWALRSAGRAVVLGFGCVFLSVVGITVWIGLTQSTGGLVADALTQTRVALWREATAVMLEHPLTGVGPTRFQDVSSIARDDPDHRWAHAEFLQQGAEQGMMGMVLSISLFGCAIIALAARARTGPVEVLAAVAVVMLGVQGAVDYVFHFPAIPLAAAALAGVGMSRRRVSGQRANGDGTVGSR